MSHVAPFHPRHWSLEIFQLTSNRRQQRSLEAFGRVGMSGVHALGVVRNDEFFVIVDAASPAEELQSRRILMSIDPLAVRVQSAGPPSSKNRHPLTASNCSGFQSFLRI
ncbi:MAG: hypothetical protein ABIN55_10975 [Aeromicrobium sp.]